MPQPKYTYTPIEGAEYEILVSKLGPDEDDWVLGKRLVAADYPDFDLERAHKAGAVKRVDAAYLIAQINNPTPVQADPNAPVMLAQPHREYGIGEQPAKAPEPPIVPPAPEG